MQFVVTDEITNAVVFTYSIAHLIKTETLERDNIFVMDSCSVHFKGDNGKLWNQLLDKLTLLMTYLQPYWRDFNYTTTGLYSQLR